MVPRHAGDTAERGCGNGSGRCPKLPPSPQEQKASPWGRGAGLGRLLPGCRLAAAAVRLACREVSLGPAAREANSEVVPREKLSGWGESDGILSAGTRLAPFGAGFLPCSSANPEEGQALASRSRTERRGERKHVFSVAPRLVLASALPARVGRGAEDSWSSAPCPAWRRLSSLVAPPKETRPSPRGEESKPTKVGSVSRRGPEVGRARQPSPAARFSAAGT